MSWALIYIVNCAMWWPLNLPLSVNGQCLHLWSHWFHPAMLKGKQSSPGVHDSELDTIKLFVFLCSKLQLLGSRRVHFTAHHEGLHWFINSMWSWHCIQYRASQTFHSWNIKWVNRAKAASRFSVFLKVSLNPQWDSFTRLFIIVPNQYGPASKNVFSSFIRHNFSV